MASTVLSVLGFRKGPGQPGTNWRKKKKSLHAGRSS